MQKICLIEAEVSASLGQRLERISSLYPNLTPVQFFIVALSRGLDELSGEYFASDDGGDE